MPSLESLHQEFKDEPFALIAIDIKEKSDSVTRYVRKNALSYTNLLDEDGTVSAQFGVSSTPVKFLIDAQGNLVAAAMGYRDWEKGEFRSIIQLLLQSVTG